MTISVLGLGAMGLPMATNLAENFGVCAYDVSAERTAAARDAGLATAASAKECVSGAEVVLIAVRNEEQLRSLLFGEAGISDALAEGALIILTSTVGIEAVKAVGANQVGDGRRTGLMSRASFLRAEAAYEAQRTADGLPLTYDVLTLHAHP